MIIIIMKRLTLICFFYVCMYSSMWNNKTKRNRKKKFIHGQSSKLSISKYTNWLLYIFKNELAIFVCFSFFKIELDIFLSNWREESSRADHSMVCYFQIKIKKMIIQKQKSAEIESSGKLLYIWINIIVSETARCDDLLLFRINYNEGFVLH